MSGLAKFDGLLAVPGDVAAFKVQFLQRSIVPNDVENGVQRGIIDQRISCQTQGFELRIMIVQNVSQYAHTPVAYRVVRQSQFR